MLILYFATAANDRLKALLTAGLKLNTAGPITTFTPSRVCAPVTRTITGLPESPVARMGVVFENGKVKTMLWGARSMDGMAWNRELAGKLGK